MSTTLPHIHNDTRGWALVHDQIRAAVAAAPQHVRALRADDPIGARTLADWWSSFSRSFVHHMHAEDDRIWPALQAAEASAAAELRALTEEHRVLERELIEVGAAVAALPDLLPTDRLRAAQEALLERFATLQRLVAEHLEREERSAFEVGEHRVDADEWGRIERDMIKGLSLRDVSTLLPRILEQADEGGRARMLARIPAPVRLLDRAVFEPHHRKVQQRLPR